MTQEEYRKLYRQVYMRKYYLAHADEFKEKARKFQREHPEKFREYMKTSKTRHRDNLYDSMGQAIRRALRGYKFRRRWESLVDFDIDTLKSHLEKQFTSEMTWENYGSYWHVDHMIPKSWFTYKEFSDEEFKKCWSLDNLQPLEAKENIKKGNRFKSVRPSLC